ncbi:hypothetical protein FXO37_23108 [Capsicum annuum]|nr:hypothetical protein FXO37_23108 [Capsicum annuum]
MVAVAEVGWESSTEDREGIPSIEHDSNNRELHKQTEEETQICDHNAKAPIAERKVDNEAYDAGGTNLDDCQVEGHGLQLLQIHDAELVAIQSVQSQEFQEAEVEASNWVNSNILELGNMYGAAFEGCEKEALTLHIKLDARNISLEKQRESTKIRTPKSRGIGKNELKNLESDLNKEVEGVRNRGRPLSLTFQ